MSKNTTRELTTAELAAELGIEKAAFVKHRSRYEEKIRAAGFNFIIEDGKNESKETVMLKKVYSLRVAHELSKKGHLIVGTQPNPNKPEFLVYLFEATLEFDRDFAIILNHK